jgi:DNA-binding transcriptional ArsR family regulator
MKETIRMPPARTAAAPMETTLAAIVAHPTRARCFVILTERTASPVEIAQEIGKDVGHVGYHVRKLLQMGLIELVDERPVRGAVEHFYRAMERAMVTEEEFAGLSVPERENFTRYIMQRLVADVARSMDQELFAERVNHIIARTPMVLDKDGFQEMSELHTELVERTLEVQAQSAERLANSGEEGISTISASLLFEVPERKRPVE